MTPAETIAMVGAALYGPRWQSDLAGDLNVSDRTMRRWVAGTDIPRVDVVSDLMRLVIARHGALDEVREALMNVELIQFRASGPKVVENPATPEPDDAVPEAPATVSGKVSLDAAHRIWDDATSVALTVAPNGAGGDRNWAAGAIRVTFRLRSGAQGDPWVEVLAHEKPVFAASRNSVTTVLNPVRFERGAWEDQLRASAAPFDH